MSNEILLELRKRKSLRQKDVIRMLDSGHDTHDALTELTILRSENLHQKLRTENFNIVMDVLELPVDNFFYPCLDNQTISLLQHQSALMHYMRYANEDEDHRKKAIEIINSLKKSDLFFQGINYQFLVSQEIILKEIFGESPSKLREMLFDGLSVTYPEVKKGQFTGDVLIFEEASLFHSLALTYKREGNTKHAIKLLHDILTGLVLLPQDDKVKERMLAPMLITLAKCYIAENNFSEAMKACDDGYRVTIKRNNGRYAPDFAELRAECYAHIGEPEKTSPLLTQAYAGYYLLRRYSKAGSLQLNAMNKWGINIQTHGMENVRPPMPEPHFSYGKPIKCGSIGELFANLRYEAGLTLQELCEGICTSGTLSKIENGSMPGNVYNLEAIMERLGRDIDKYFHTFLHYDEYPIKQLRNEVWSLSVNLKYEEMEKKLNELKEAKSHKKGVGLQFVKLMEARLYGVKNGHGEGHIAKLHEVLTTMRKKFDIGMTARTRLGKWDIMALNQMAGSLCESGNLSKGLRLFEDLKESIDCYYVDESEKMLMYTTILYNYSKYLGLVGRYHESIDVANMGADLDAKHGKLNRMPRFAVNKACAMLDTGNKEESLPHFAQAYYGSTLLGRQGDVKAITKYVAEKKLNIGL